MARAYISLGTNLGDKGQNLRTAARKIKEQVEKVISLSAFYIIIPWGFDSEHSPLNAAACVEAELSSLEALQKTQETGRELGRTHRSVDGAYSDRLIGIDLPFYDDLMFSVTSPSGAALNPPHPLMTERDFVMCPLTEIASELVHPVSGKVIRVLPTQIEKWYNILFPLLTLLPFTSLFGDKPWRISHTAHQYCM